MSSSFNRNIDRLRQGERANTQRSISQRTNMAARVGDQGIRDAAAVADSLKEFSSTLKEFHEYHKEEQEKIGFNEYKQYKKVNAEKYLELENQITQAEGNQKKIEELRRRQLELKGKDGYVDAERISHLSDFAQVSFLKQKLQNVIPTFEPKFQDAMQNSDQEITIGGIKYKSKDIHNDNTHPLEFKKAAIEHHSDNIWKNSGLDQYSPEMLEYAGVTEAFDKAKKSLNDKYTQRYNIEKSSVHREKHEKAFDESPITGDSIELLHKGSYSTFDGKGNLMDRAGAWKVVEAKLLSRALSSGEEPDVFINNVLDQEIPEDWARELGVPKGTTFNQHWPNKAGTIIAAAEKSIADKVKADKAYGDSWVQGKINDFNDKTRQGPLTEAQVEQEKLVFTSRGIPVPDDLLDYLTPFDQDVEEDKANIIEMMKTNPEEITEQYLKGKNPFAREGIPGLDALVKANEQEVLTKVTGPNGTLEPSKAIKSLLDTTLDGMNLVGNEKDETFVHSKAAIEHAYLEKYYQNINDGMTPDVAAYQALNGENGVLTDIRTNQNDSQYLVAPNHHTQVNKFKPNEVLLGEIESAKIELNAGVNPEEVHIGGPYADKHLETIQENIKKYGLWRGLDKSKQSVQYYQGISRGKKFASGGNYVTLIDSQLRLKGHPGFFGSEMDVFAYNHPELALNKINFDYAEGDILDNMGFKEVWNESLNLLNFKDIDHWLQASSDINDSTSGDTGFWSEVDNISFINDYDLEFGEIF